VRVFAARVELHPENRAARARQPGNAI